MLVDAWGFKAASVLVWSKPPKGAIATFTCSAEFVLFARRGSLAAIGKHPKTVFDWPRGAHSAKPDAFFDLVKQVSPGPYAELFARRARFGWDYPIGGPSPGRHRGMKDSKMPSPSGEARATRVSAPVDPCEAMPTPGAGDSSDSQHGRFDDDLRTLERSRDLGKGGD